MVDTLVTHANMKGLGLIPLFGDRHGFMPPQLKTQTRLRNLKSHLHTKLRLSSLKNKKTWENSAKCALCCMCSQTLFDKKMYMNDYEI